MKRKAHVTDIRVPWADVDRAQVVYFGAFFNYFEVGEFELFRALGTPRPRFYRDLRFSLPRVEAFCKYLAPAHEDDLLEVHTWVEEVRSKSYRLAHEVYRKADGKLLATGYVTCVCARRDDNGLHAIPVPAELRELLLGTPR